MAEEKKTNRSKLLSVKFWVVAWAMALITFIVVTDRQAFLDIAKTLCFVPPAYIGCNVWQKNILKKDGQ